MDHFANRSSELSEVKLNNETHYHISNVDAMRPFFMSIVSDSNLWMFVGSNGGLTAGRKNAEQALFPYYTDDKIIESVETTGSKSIFLVSDADKTHVWEPFSSRYSSLYKTTRNLYKNVYGNKILFEEINHDLELGFRYQWSSSNRYGFVRTCTLENLGQNEHSIHVLDGLQNIMPYGAGSYMQNQNSNLVDAYKRNELDEESGIGIFGLSAIIVDKAEPSEALKANVVWSVGLSGAKHLLSSMQLDRFRNRLPITEEKDIKGERGAYFISKKIALKSGESKKWMIVADVSKSSSAVAAMASNLKNDAALEDKIHQDIQDGTRNLIELNAAADAMQLTNDPYKDTRHFSNTLFNVMRGGIFDNNYQIEKNDLLQYLHNANTKVVDNNANYLKRLPAIFSLTELTKVSSDANDAVLHRLCTEYMPLKFSRRHGDPSRPWNRFSINTHDEQDGSKILDYEGNWRDIFQNWEALAHSYPEFMEGMIFRFLNASTFDGYNPYRITKNGIDWEKIEPDDPWSYIGYWGDHQIIYLLKFLEFFEDSYPGKPESFFTSEIFVYANVPYRIKSYKELLDNPKDTIDFDHETDQTISENWSHLGSDSALLRSKNGDIVQVNFMEKMLATLMAKISNFIPEGGIWMNTQRPEWNDANNALVGYGVSAVTLYYLYRFLKFKLKMLRNSKTENVLISSELKSYFDRVVEVLENNKEGLSSEIDDKFRKKVMDGLGEAASTYRLQIYTDSFEGEKQNVPLSKVIHFTELCLQYTGQSIKANKRPDNLYHAYNLMSIGGDGVSVAHLSEMLEGQVAVLSSGYLSAEEALEVLDALKASSLFRKDQNSYILYPNKNLPGFMHKNNVPANAVESSDLLRALIEDGHVKIIEKDINGNYHFNGNFRNAGDLNKALKELSGSKCADLAQNDSEHVLQLFEEVFNHKAFTGRSGTFFGYEGLGSIYWHMVSKLALAAQECCFKAIHDKEDDSVIKGLVKHYYEIVDGIGLHKSPKLYGAFPTDPYSHTPAGKGAQQPGMTGQVKEDILCRFGELGIVVKDGKLGFQPTILRKEEFLKEARKFSYLDVGSGSNNIELGQGSLAFTYCQVPVAYKIAEETQLEVVLSNDEVVKTVEPYLNTEISKHVFERSGKVKMITAKLKKDMLI